MYMLIAKCSITSLIQYLSIYIFSSQPLKSMYIRCLFFISLIIFYLPIISNMFGYFLFLLSLATCQVPPTWVTSPYVRAASNKVISTLTGSTSTPAYTFTFSSPFSTVPNIAYGINKYIGKLRM